MQRPDAGIVEAISTHRAAKLVHPVWIMLVVGVLAYGLLLPQMGFLLGRVAHVMDSVRTGTEAMTRYFSTNRTSMGPALSANNAALPHIPIYWEILALVCAGSRACPCVVDHRNLSPRNREFALVTALAFLLYPGFNQQWTSYLYSHFFIVLCFLLLSFLCFFEFLAVSNGQKGRSAA